MPGTFTCYFGGMRGGWEAHTRRAARPRVCRPRPSSCLVRMATRPACARPCCKSGEGVAKNLKRAVEWCTKTRHTRHLVATYVRKYDVRQCSVTRTRS